MRPAVIAPAVLAHTFEEFQTQISHVTSGTFPHVHIDVMDGKFVPHASFSEIDEIEALDIDLPFELHLMVEDPLAELEKWAAVGNVFRAIFHVESPKNLDIALALAEDTELTVGLALNPDTSLEKLKPYTDRIDLVHFMTVYPGQQGAPFVPKVKEKIAAFAKSHEGILISADGAINKSNIKELRDLGVDTFAIGSALIQAADITAAYQELKQAVS